MIRVLPKATFCSQSVGLQREFALIPFVCKQLNYLDKSLGIVVSFVLAVLNLTEIMELIQLKKTHRKNLHIVTTNSLVIRFVTFILLFFYCLMAPF